MLIALLVFSLKYPADGNEQCPTVWMDGNGIVRETERVVSAEKTEVLTTRNTEQYLMNIRQFLPILRDSVTDHWQPQCGRLGVKNIDRLASCLRNLSTTW